jgi:hypothetical protein
MTLHKTLIWVSISSIHKYFIPCLCSKESSINGKSDTIYHGRFVTEKINNSIHHLMNLCNKYQDFRWWSSGFWLNMGLWVATQNTTAHIFTTMKIPYQDISNWNKLIIVAGPPIPHFQPPTLKKDRLMRSPCCLCVSPLLLPGNGLVNMFPWKQIHVQH